MISMEALFRKSLVGILQSPRFSEAVLTDVLQKRKFVETFVFRPIVALEFFGRWLLVVYKNNLRLMVDGC
jgi:hypothetical protein